MSGRKARYRLSIDFAERQALFDFVDWLRRTEFLPREAWTAEIGMADTTEQPVESYIVTVGQAGAQTRVDGRS